MKRYFLLSIILLACAPLCSFAMTGIIETPHRAKICYDPTCTAPAPGMINFKPTGGNVVIDSITGLHGNIWSSQLGWIDLAPSGQGVTFADANSGTLTGKAWSQVAGWINFRPTGQGVTIDPVTGQFSGWAWAGGPYGGWIKFDCSSPDSCVQSSWRRAVDQNAGSPGARVTVIDVCSSIPNNQVTVPVGYGISENGSCYKTIDVCPNIIGTQDVLPTGFTINLLGSCVPIGLDYCPNIIGLQGNFPSGYTMGTGGLCVPITQDACVDTDGNQENASSCRSADICSNIIGTQESIPSGYVALEGACYPKDLDVCMNIKGNQTVLPKGMTIKGDGSCVPRVKDVCENIAGDQPKVPKGYTGEEGICLYGIEDGSSEWNFPKITDQRFSHSVARIFNTMNEHDSPIMKIMRVTIKSLGIFAIIALVLRWLATLIEKKKK